MASITDSIREVLSRSVNLTVDVDSLGDEDNLYLVGLTSHGVVNVLVELEDHLQIELPDTLLLCATELHAKDKIDALVGALAGA